jgi:NADPH:quinone reductase-like Zn-dependent oxidoreductase
VVVTGAGGGLGIHAIQAAVALGGRVMAVTTSPEKLGEFASLGAEEILHSDELDFSELVLALTEDQGADVIIDNVGSALFQSTIRCLAQYGRLVLLGEIAGRTVELNLAEIIFRDARVLGSSGVSRATIQRVASMVSEGLMDPIVSQPLPLEEALTVVAAMAERRVLGRVAFNPGL